MITVETIEKLGQLVSEAQSRGKKIGFVPTMGALHAGHIRLIETAVKQTDFVVVSIFVNPAQFGPSEDVERYPRDLAADEKACSDAGADVVFAPSVEQMYPQENVSWVNVEKLTDKLCGKSRPGHFRGVATVCAKLFNIVRPDVAFFGQKDAQQAAVIKRMVADLNMPLQIAVCPTVREKDGLAMSSRNRYLSQEHRKQAALLYAALQECEVLIAQGIDDSKTLIAEMTKLLSIGADIEIDYISIVDADTLETLSKAGGRALVALAVKLGPARLIDNILLDLTK